MPGVLDFISGINRGVLAGPDAIAAGGAGLINSLAGTNISRRPITQMVNSLGIAQNEDPLPNYIGEGISALLGANVAPKAKKAVEYVVPKAPVALQKKVSTRLTPAERQYFEEMMDDTPNWEEILEKAPSIKFDGKSLAVSPAHQNALREFVEQHLSWRVPGERFPPSFHSGKFWDKFVGD